MSVKNILKVEELVFERNDSPLFHPVNFLVGCGEALHVEGANGSGKTTLFQLLTGLLQPSQGSILFCGRPFEQCKYEYFSDLLYIGHQPAVKAMLSVRENLQWMSPANTSSVQIVSALVAVGLQDYAHIPCHKLSAGQQRRVALARLITSKANLWYLDEPLAALDKQGVDFVENCMQQHTEKGGSIVFSSHQDLAKMPARKLRINRYCEVD